MSATDAPPSGPPFERSPDLEWFRALERAVIALRGAPLQFSADDYRMAKTWRSAGVPLDLVIDVIEASMDRQREADAELKRRLRYYGKAVERAWRERRELQAGATQPADLRSGVLAAQDEPAESSRASRDHRLEDRPDDRPGDQRLGRLAGSLPPAHAAIAERVRALETEARDLDTAQLEDRLAALDDALLDAALASLDEAASARLDTATAEAVAGLAGRVPTAEIEASLPRLRRRLLRRQLGLPVLSLLSPEALG